MSKKTVYLLSFVLLLGSVSIAEDIAWTDLGADHLWSNPDNWNLGRVPTSADDVLIDVPAAAAPNGPVIQDGIAAEAHGIFTEAAGEPTLTMTGGSLAVADWIWLGDGADSFGVWTISGGTVDIADEFELGWGGGAGTLTVTGGTINAGKAVIPTDTGVFGDLSLQGGTYSVTKVDGLQMNANGLIDITEGTLVLEGDDTAKVDGLIAAGQITAHGGAGEFELDFDVRNPGKTTLTASREPAMGPLRLDFNSNQDSGGDSTTAGDPSLSAAAHNQTGWSSYHANHEVIAEFTTVNYDGITVTPDWPNTTDNRVRQSIDRGTGNDDNWDDAAGDLNLVTDFIGIDTRTGNGGNGDWDGATGTPTYMTLAVGGLAAGDYVWTSFHHDTEHVFGPFAVWLSTDGGATFTQLDDGVMTDSTTGGNPDSGATEVGPDAYSLSSTYHASFRTDGINAVVFRFAPYSETAVHRQIWGMNGLVLERGPRVVLFAEDFEGLALGPNVDESLAGDAVWTDTPPEGWTVDESGIPGIGIDAIDGVTEWAGWAFTDKAWWTEAAGDQDRSLFELGSGTVAVADPDEWDDGERLPLPIEADPYDTWLTTPEIKISGSEAGTLELKFDSSWRPEFDSNYHQTANITASFDGGDLVEVMLWESDEASANFHPYATNETVIVNLDNPEGAKKVVLTFGLFDAGNDWWWAIDNLEVSAVVPDLGPVNPGTNGLVASYALDGDATDGSGNGNDGTIHNADTGGLGDGGSVWVDDPERGIVISFNGTAEGAHVRAGDIPQMTLTNDFTWSFWANHSDENTADNDIILGNRMDENIVDFVPRQFIKFTPTKFEWHMNGNGDDNLDYDDIPAGIWLHHSVVKAGDQLTYYRNGIEASSGTFTQPLDFPQPLYFGGDNESSAGENWAGLMSDVSIYDRALSEAEIRYLAGERATPVDPGSSGLIASWTCDEGAGAVVGDVSGNGRDGTFVNGDPAWVEGVSGSAVELVGPTLIETPPLDLELSEATMAGWIKPNGAQPDWSSIIMQRDPGLATGFNILGFQLAYHWNDTSDSWGHRGGDMIAEDDWTFAAVTIEPDKATFYVNGETGSVNEAPHEPALWNSNVYLGGDGTAGWVSRRMNGALDNVIMYDRALSAGEIRYLAGIREFTYDGGALDDTWDHDNGSDAWDGTGPGEGNPGGAVSLTEGDDTFLRIQDTGDPRDLGISDPSNRKVYLTRLTDISLDGLRLEVRVRVATTAPLDNQISGDPWPAEGIGYHIRDGGKGMIGVSDGVGIISFSLGQAGEPDFVDATTDVLIMNSLVGTEPTSDVDTGDAANAVALNMMDIADAAAWNTFVINIVAGGAGTHVVSVSANGGPEELFDVTLGSDLEADAPFIAIGSSGTGGITAFDVDSLSVSN